MKFLILVVALVAQFGANAAVIESTQEKNKRIVTEFYNMAFNEHQAVEAAYKYLAESYIQHNPHVADGRKGFIEAFSGSTGSETSSVDFKRFISENDLVVVHSHEKQNPQDRGYASVDIFRVEGDLIAEHWDVGQKIPETSKNDNTMF